MSDGEARRSFTSKKLDWLIRVLDDGRVTDAQFRIAFALSTHLNAQTCEAYPRQELLAARCGCTVRAVQVALRTLADLGYIHTRPGRGPGNPNRYRMIERT